MFQSKLQEFEKYLGKFSTRLVLYPDMSGRVEYYYYGEKDRTLTTFSNLEEFENINVLSTIKESGFVQVFLNL